MSGQLDAQALLNAWERAANDHPVDRALGVLAAIRNLPTRELARLDIGRRDALLLRCHAELFGKTIVGTAHCPSCGCAVEVALAAPDELDPAPGASDDWFGIPGSATVEGRLPTSLDLSAITGCASVETARDMLRERCIRAAWELDETEYARAEEEIARRAGVAGLTVDPQCPSCSRRWSLDLDIASFFWDELNAMAGRLLREVDALARRYGWSESEILSFSQARRSHYLEFAE